MIGVVAVVSGLFLGRVLRSRAPRVADAFHFSASALVRLLAAAVLTLVGFRLVDDHDPLRIGLAVLLFIVAAAATLMAALMVYFAATGRTDPPKNVERS